MDRNTNKVLGGRTRFCRWCGMRFTECGNRIYCSKTCEREAYKTHGIKPEDLPEHKPGKPLQPEIRICRTCAKPFVTRHEGMRYCSDKCRFHKAVVRLEMERNGSVQELLQTEAVL